MRLFTITFPKSGTHLIRQLMRPLAEPCPRFPRGFNSFSSGWGPFRSSYDVAVSLMNVTEGRQSYGHVVFDEQIAKVLTSREWFTIMLIRDLRDVAISLCYHIEQGHKFPKKAQTALMTWDHDRRLLWCLGWVAEKWRYFRQWMLHPEIVLLMFRDVRRYPRDAATLILRELERRRGVDSANEPMIQSMVDSIYPKGSPTFRTGLWDNWEKEFKAEHFQRYEEKLENYNQELWNAVVWKEY